MTLRAGLPSTVHETLAKTADFSIYVRDRKPSAHFSSNAYVLPRTGQRGIPVDQRQHPRARGRNLPRRRPQSDRHDRRQRRRQRRLQASLSRCDIDRLGETRGVAVWKGELAVAEAPLNADVTTAFPVDQAVGDLKPGVYVMVAQPKEIKDVDTITTRWRRSGSSSPISGSPRFPAMTASTPSSIRWRPPRARAASSCGSFRAATKYWRRRKTDASRPRASSKPG